MIGRITGILLENNVAYHCTDAGFHQHYGRDNIVRNNLLAYNFRHSVMRGIFQIITSP